MSGARTIRLLLADVDETLLTKDKVLTGAAKEAARELRHAGIVFAITSGLCRRAPLPIATRTRVSPKRCGSSFCGRPPHDPPRARRQTRMRSRASRRGVSGGVTDAARGRGGSVPPPKPPSPWSRTACSSASV
jgi:hypothetical protein